MGLATAALTVLLAASAAGEEGTLRVMLEHPLSALSGPDAMVAVTVCDLSGPPSLGGGCSNGARSQTRLLTAASFPDIGASDRVTLSFGVWASPVSLNITAIAGADAGSGPDTAPQLTADDDNVRGVPVLCARVVLFNIGIPFFGGRVPCRHPPRAAPRPVAAPDAPCSARHIDVGRLASLM